MALLRINGVDMPPPTEMEVGIQDLVKAERNTRGNLIKEKINTKARLALSWKFLNAEDTSMVLQALGNNFFDVTYLNPETNAMRTATFYSGDRSIPVMDMVDGVIRYKDIKVSVIEK